MLLQISAIALICTIVFIVIIRNFYRIPDLKTLQKILDESDIHSILIATKFQRCTLIEVHKPSLKNETKEIPPYKPPEKPFITVTSKMVGRYYATDHDDGTTLVREGQSVKAGEKIGYIFALHLKNEVYAEHDGIIKKILIPDGGMVQYGWAILQIEIE